MATPSSKCFFFSILSLAAVCCSGRHGAPLFEGSDRKTMHDTITSPTIITIPATNPVTVTPSSPAATPASVPLTTPISVPATNPANTPVPFTDPVAPTVTIPGAQPITNPVTTYPAPSVTNPPATTNPPASAGQTSWCVARSGAAETALQSALDYACGVGGTDCSQIQQGGNCYNPNTLENHASFAFNSYFQKNPAPTSCDFGGTAIITNSNPSSGSCIYPLSSSSSTPASLTPAVPTPASLTPTIPTPTPTTPITIPPTTDSTPMPFSPAGTGVPDYGTPPTVANTSNPGSSIGNTNGYGSEIPPSSTTSMSMAAGLRPVTCCIIVMMSLISRRFILDC